MMPTPLTADDIVPLIAALTPKERVRLLRLITTPSSGEAEAYRLTPPSREEFFSDDESLAWESEGWGGIE